MGAEIVGLAVLTGLLCGGSPPDAAKPPSDLVVHEWGTFLAMSGSDGVSLDGMYHEEHALPGFVHARSRDQLRWRSILTKGETPVIYFYTGREQNASVEVRFPKGVWTQWYPQAAFVLPRLASLPVPATEAPRDGRIVWNVQITPALAKDLTPRPPAASADALWNFAREVDAAFVKAYDPTRPGLSYDTERFLFYRGLGTAPLPVRMTADDGGTITADPAGPGVTHLFVLRVEGGRGLFRYYPSLAPGRTITKAIPPMARPIPAGEFAGVVADALAARLVESGLYPKEARAMVNTWRSSYFGTDGVRALFILPQAWTEASIPLRVDPTPKSVTRVMVGRLELLTPGRERLAEAAVRGLASADPAERFEAFQTLEAQGRYVEPILRRILASTSDERVRTLCRRLLLAGYVTDLRAAVRSPVATRPAPAAMTPNEDPAYIRARLAGLLREVGLDDEAKAEGVAAQAGLGRIPRRAGLACESRHDLRALALALEATGDDRGAAKPYGELVDLGGAATRRQDCRQCHQQSGAAIAGGLRGWWAGEAYAKAEQRSGRLGPTVAAAETSAAIPSGRDAARLRLAFLYSLAGRTADAEAAWTAIGEPRTPVSSRD